MDTADTQPLRINETPVGQRNIIFHLLLLCCTAGGITAASSSDFLVIGNPAVCDLFDQYEQPLPASQKKRLPPNAPFEIVKEQQLMGDQITQAMRLSHLASTYYLMLDDKGKPAGLPPASSTVRFKECTPMDDTVIVAVPSVKLTSRYPSGGNVVAVKKDETLIRIFGWRGASFIYRPGTPSFFGWTNAPRSAFKAPKKKAASAGEDFSPLHQRIMRRLADANERYDTLFLFFNRVSGLKKAVPQWDYSTKGNRHIYSLRGSEATVRQLEASTSYIVGDIENILLGKPYTVFHQNGVITISTR